MVLWRQFLSELTWNFKSIHAGFVKFLYSQKLTDEKQLCFRKLFDSWASYWLKFLFPFTTEEEVEEEASQLTRPFQGQVRQKSC